MIAFDGPAARAFGAVAGALCTAGRKNAARAYDALIAATAIANGLPLFTCNPIDFDGIPGLDLRIVPYPDASITGFPVNTTATQIFSPRYSSGVTP